MRLGTLTLHLLSNKFIAAGYDQSLELWERRCVHYYKYCSAQSPQQQSFLTVLFVPRLFQNGLAVLVDTCGYLY
jgi:hypothetical protein